MTDTVRETWPELRHALRRDATVAHLHAVSEGDSFDYLWMNRLGQPGQSLEALGRRVRGGGLRLVLPPNPDDWDGPHAEIRIESFFADLSQLFVEGHFEWREPAWLTNLNVRDMLHTVEAYLDAEVRVFVSSVAA